MTPERIEREREVFERFLFKKFELDYDDLEMRDVYFRRRKNGEYWNDTFTEKFDIWLARAAQSEWISVKDSLPENDQNLMSKGSLGTNQKYFIYPNPLSKFSPVVPAVMIAYRCLDQETGEYVWGDSMMYPSLSIKNITHWQPIKSPEPPTTNPAA